MIRKHVCAALLCCGLFFAVSGATGDQGMAPDMQRILSKKKIVVAMISENIPPFIFQDENGKLQGLDVDISRDIASALGVELEFVRKTATYDGVIDLIAKKRADIAVSYLSATPVRAVRVGFTEPYFMACNAFLINRMKLPSLKPDSDPADILNSKDVAIGTVAASAYVGFAKRDYPNASIKEYTTWNEAAQAAVDGDIHAAFFDNVFVLSWIQQHPDKALYVKPVVLKNKPDPISIVTQWQDTHLLFWLNLYLKQISNDGTLKRMKEKHFSRANTKKGEKKREEKEKDA